MKFRAPSAVTLASLVMTLALFWTGLSHAAPAPQTLTWTSNHIQTVFLIVMENHNWSKIKGSTSAPYINSVLLPMGAHAEAYYNPPDNHPSLPNYLWLEAGRSFGINNDGFPSVHAQTTTNHLVTRLKNLGISWKGYFEDIPGTSCPLASVGLYAVNHNPFVYFNDVTGNGSLTSWYCLQHIRPFTDLQKDIADGTLPHYVYIVPNLCDDMHDWCTSDRIFQGDAWLERNLPMILNSSAYQNGAAVFITWDESETPADADVPLDLSVEVRKDFPVGLILLSKNAKAGYSNWIHYNHGALLRTVEEIFGIVPAMPLDIARDADLSDLFVNFP